MSADNLDTDALATEEMLKMFESMESHSLDNAMEATLTEPMAKNIAPESMPDMDLSPIEIGDDLSELETMTMIDLPDIELSDSVDAEIIEMPAIELSVHTNTDTEIVEMPDDDESLSALTMEPSIEDSVPLEAALDDLVPIIEEAQVSEMAREAEAILSVKPEVSPTAAGNPIADHLNAVVENAVQALQDWLRLRQQSEENSPATQGLAQLDVLLDTVTHQQQQLAVQLSQAPKIDLSGIAEALGVSLPTPQALGWSQDEWRSKAQAVASKTDDITALNVKLRKQLEQF